MKFIEHGVWPYHREMHTKWYNAVRLTSPNLSLANQGHKLPWLHNAVHTETDRSVDELIEDTDFSGSDQIIQVLCIYYLFNPTRHGLITLVYLDMLCSWFTKNSKTESLNGIVKDIRN